MEFLNFYSGLVVGTLLGVFTTFYLLVYIKSKGFNVNSLLEIFDDSDRSSANE
jgi:hypothetical protein